MVLREKVILVFNRCLIRSFGDFETTLKLYLKAITALRRRILALMLMPGSAD